MLREKYAIDQYSRSKSEARRLSQSANQSAINHTALGMSAINNSHHSHGGSTKEARMSTSYHGLRRSSTNLIL